MDDDILGLSLPSKPAVQQPQTTPSITDHLINPMYGNTAPLAAQSMQTHPTPNYINPMYGTTAPLAAQNIQQQQHQNSNLMNNTNMNMNNMNMNMNYINPMYGTTAPMVAQNIQQQQHQQQQHQQFANMNLVNPMYGTTAPMVAQQQQQNQYQNMNMNIMYGANSPNATTNYQSQEWLMQGTTNTSQPTTNQYNQYNQAHQNISLNTKTSTNSSEFGNFQSSAPNSNVNVIYIIVGRLAEW